MKLATLKSGGRDGTLVVVSRDLVTCQAVPKIARTLQDALDDWDTLAPRLQAVYDLVDERWIHVGYALGGDPAPAAPAFALR